MAAKTSLGRRLRQQIRERQPRQAQAHDARLDVSGGEPQTFGVWLTTIEACAYLRYTGKHKLRSLYKFIERNGVKVARRSPRKLLIARVDLDEAIGAGRRR